MTTCQHLIDDIIPALETALEDNNEWWNLKDGSPIKAYFETIPNKLRRPDNFVTPATLIRLIRDQIHLLDLGEEGNNDIIHTENSPLQSCFQSTIIYAPNLYHLCLPHVNIVSHIETREQLKHAAVKNELYIESPATILYQDPTAQFWIPPVFNQIICQNTKISYSWNELHDLFTRFFTTPNTHIMQLDATMIAILPSSGLADYIKFKHLHRNQINLLLQHSAKFLGKTSTMLTLCPKLNFTQCKPTDPVVFWLENLITANNKHGLPRTLNLMLE